FALFALAQPVVMEAHAVDRAAELAEGMDIGITEPPPVTEFDTEFEGGTRLPHEVRLVEAEGGVEKADVGNGRLADPDDSDLRGFNEPDCALMLQDFRERCGRHPAGRSPADDHDVPDSAFGHAAPFCCGACKARARGSILTRGMIAVPEGG